MNTHGIGYRYQAPDGSSPNSFRGVGVGATVDYIAEITQSGNLSFKIQQSADGSSFENANVSGMVVSMNYSNSAKKTYSSGDSSNQLQLTAANDLVNGQYSVVLKNLPRYYNNNSATPYTYNISKEESQLLTTNKREINVTESTKDIVVTAKSQGNNSIGDFTITVIRSYTTGESNTVTENVNNLRAETYYGEYTVTNGSCTINEADKIGDSYKFRVNGLPAGYTYRLIDSSNTETVLSNTENSSQVTSSAGNQYVQLQTPNGSDKPLSESDYSGLTQADLTAVNNTLNSAYASKKLLNTKQTMNDDNVWTSRVQVRIGYSYYPRSSTNPWGYDLRDFAEHIQSTSQNDNVFTLRSFTNDDSNLSAMQWMNAIKPASNAWITMLPEDYKDSSKNDKVVKVGTGENEKTNIFDLTTKEVKYQSASSSEEYVDPTKYEWLAGIYKAVYTNGNSKYERWYAVQEIPCDTAKNGNRLSELTFQNTRIGIVNYHIQFDWKVGDRREDMKNVSLQIFADYNDGKGARLVKVDNKDHIDIEMIKKADGTYVNDYYITNLPKYSSTGQIISYTVKELEVNNTPFVNDKCTIGNDTLSAVIEEPDYYVNPNSNSDDLISIVITNSFEGNTDFTVNKIWKDDTNARNTRTDLIIRLYQHTTDPNGASDKTYGIDYNWKKHSTDTDNRWSYTYNNLDKYDEKGYRYQYYVKEITTKLKKNDYVTSYENSVHTTATATAISSAGTSGTYSSNDSVFEIPASDITAGFKLTISGLDYQDNYFETTDDSARKYLYRVTNQAGTPYKSQEVEISQSEKDSNGNVTVTITPHLTFTNPSADKFIFRLQRKVTAENDDKYKDVPDYYKDDSEGVESVDPAEYNDDGNHALEDDNTTYGRAYDNGTITNKLVGTVKINVKKLWQSIDPNFDSFNYPIADVFLYANVKSEDTNGDYESENTQYSVDPKDSNSTRDFDQGGYAILGGADPTDPTNAALGKLVNMLQIVYRHSVISVSSNEAVNGVITREVEDLPTADSDGKQYTSYQAVEVDESGKELTDQSKIHSSVTTVDGNKIKVTVTRNLTETTPPAYIYFKIARKVNGNDEYVPSFTGQENYVFEGQRTYKDNSGNVQYLNGTDYIKFDDYNTYSYLDGKGGKPLDKYDENGALIKYSIRERAINGYTYRISNGTIINEYKGGDRVQVKVTKNWKNMTAASKFPIVRFTLHQCYVGLEETEPHSSKYEYKLKEYNTFSERIAASTSDPVSYIFGNNDKDILYKYSPTGEEFFYYVTEELQDADGNGRVSFQKKYTINQANKEINPVPELLTYTWNGSDMVLTDDVKLEGLGFTCTIKESEEDCFKADSTTGIITVPRSEVNSEGKIVVKIENLPELTNGSYTVEEVDQQEGSEEIECSYVTENGKVTLTVTKEMPSENPPEFIKFKIKKGENDVVTEDADDNTIKAIDTSLNPDIPIYKRIDVENDYAPNEENFKSTITIDKNWELYSKAEQNPLNEEFNGINNYSFTLKRKTKFILQKSLFHITTGTANTNTGVPEIKTDGNYSDAAFDVQIETPDDSSNTIQNNFVGMTADGNRVNIEADNVSYYQATLLFTKPTAYNDNERINVTVKVYKATKKVVIEGLAVYGQDGIPYTYMIEEINSEGDVCTPAEKRKQQKITPIYDVNVSFNQTAAQSENTIQPLTFKVQRKLEGNYYVDGLLLDDSQFKYNGNNHSGSSYPNKVTWNGYDYYVGTVTEGTPVALYKRTGTSGSYVYTETEKTLLKTKYEDLTADIISSENITAVDNTASHTFTAVNGLYSIPAEFAENDESNKKFTAIIRELPAKDNSGNSYEYKVVDGEGTASGNIGSLVSYNSDGDTINIVITKSGVSSDNTSPCTFYVQRKTSSTEFANVTEGLPFAVDASSKAHTISSDGNGVFTVPTAYAVNGNYSVQVKNLPDRCSEDEYVYKIVNTSGDTDISSTSEKGQKVLGGVVNMGLHNQLKQFTLRLNKIFGAEYTENGVTKYKDIAPEDYSLYFGTDFLNRLRFEVQRSTDGTNWTPYIKYTVDQNKDKAVITPHTNEAPYYSDITDKMSKYDSGANKDKYYYDFKYLPLLNARGVAYKYRIVEYEDSVGEFVKIYYPSSGSETAVPLVNAEMKNSEVALSFTLQQSTNGGESYTAVTGETLTFSDTKATGASYDPLTGIVTVPRESNIDANGKYNFTISGLPAQNDNIKYRITDVKGGTEATCSQTTSDSTATLTVDASSKSKYFVNNYPKVISSNWGTIDTYVRNIFQSKEITLKKLWDDGDNADGLRPEILDVTIQEKVNGLNGGNVTKQLENKDKWEKTVLLPKYYYNGDLPQSEVKFSLTEDLEKARQYYETGSKLSEIGYTKSEEGYILNDNNTNTDKAWDFSAVSTLKGTNDVDFEGMYLVNHKEYINSQLTFEKNWDDNNNQQNTRSDSIYIKTLRRTKGSLFSKNDVYEAKNSDIDFNQITLFQNLPLYYEAERTVTEGQTTTTVTDQYPYVYYLEPANNSDISKIKPIDIDADGTIKVNLSEVTGDEVDFKLKRKVSSYTYQTYTENGNNVFTVPLTDAMNGQYSIRLKGLDVEKDGINCVYKIVDRNENDIAVKMKHIQTEDGKKNIVFVPVESNGTTPMTFNTDLNFKVMCYSGEEDAEGNQVFNPVSTGFTVEKYYDFKEFEPLDIYQPSDDEDDIAKYTIQQKDKINDKYSFKVSGLPAGSYKIADSDGNELAAAQTTTVDNTDIIFMVDSSEIELVFKIQKMTGGTPVDLKMNDVNGFIVGKYYEEVVTKDKNKTQLRLEYFPTNAKTDVVTTDHYHNPIGYEDNDSTRTYTAYKINDTQKMYSVLVKGLDAKDGSGNDYSYQTTDNNDSVKIRPIGDGKVDVLVQKTVAIDDSDAFTFTLQRSANGGEYENVTGTLSTVRFFAADTDGIVQLPSDVAKSVAENLAYGVSIPTTVVDGESVNLVSQSKQFNGLWEKYYYTVVECDKYGLDDHSSLTFSQTEIVPDSSSDDLNTSKKLIFGLDTNSYHSDDDSTPRKYLNIKVVNKSISGDPIVKRDVNGDALKVTIWNAETGNLIGEYYASDEENTIPAEGVIVIPTPVYCDSLICEVEGLPYGKKATDGSWTGEGYTYSVERCKASGKSHSNEQQLQFVALPVSRSFKVWRSNDNDTNYELVTDKIKEVVDDLSSEDYIYSENGTLPFVMGTPKGNNIHLYVKDLDSSYTYKITDVDDNNFTNDITYTEKQSDGKKYLDITVPVRSSETPFTEDTDAKHKSVNFSYTKTWDETSDYYNLRPEKVYFALYRQYEGGTDEELVGHFERTVTENTVSGDTAVSTDWLAPADTPLPAGKLVHVDIKGKVIDDELSGVDVWRPYTYYLKEYTEDTYTTEKSINNQYESSFLKEPDKPFVLQDDYKNALLDQGLKNKLRKTKHEVLKIWDDENNTFESREDYTLVLQRRTDSGKWEDVDLRYVVVSSVKVNDSTKEKTFTRVPITGTAPVTELKVNQDKLQYCFDNLPIYSPEGLEYDYQIIERYIGSNKVEDDQTYLLFVPGTLVEDDEFSYVRTIRRGTANYYVDYGEEEKKEYTNNEGVTYSGEPTDSQYTAESYGECRPCKKSQSP